MLPWIYLAELCVSMGESSCGVLGAKARRSMGLVDCGMRDGM